MGEKEKKKHEKSHINMLLHGEKAKKIGWRKIPLTVSANRKKIGNSPIDLNRSALSNICYN